MADLFSISVCHFSMLVLSLLFVPPDAQQVLLEHGVVTNQADTEGVTPLLACIEAVPNGTARLAVAEVSESQVFCTVICNLHSAI